VAVLVGTAPLAGRGAASAAPANPSPPTTSAASARSLRYVVRPGDSFSGVAATYGMSPAAVARANGLRLTSVLLPGQVLTIPITLPPGLPARLPVALLAVPQRLTLFPVFVAAAKEFGVPADLLMATAYIESGWKQSAVSPSGAIGVGQLHPDTAQWVAIVLLHQPGLDPNNAKDNIRMSARFLRYLLDTSPTTARALVSYFQGPGATVRDGISTTGLAYAARILAIRSAFS
jgi:soluble lytic murein transglycosylase-like protein